MTPILEVAERLGARLKRVGALEYQGPCPACGGRDRFSINTAKGVFNCRNCCVGGDAVALVRHVLGFGFNEALQFIGDKRVREVSAQHAQKTRSSRQSRHLDAIEASRPNKTAQVAQSGDDTQRTADAIQLFRESVDPRGTIAETYFKSRSLEIADLAGRVVRWNPRIGAVIALFRNITSGAPQAISRTFLDADGRKIERKFLGPVGRSAVMLDSFDSVNQGLHISEGIESGQAARQLGLRPCWAVGSAGAVAAFPVLSGITCLTLLGENDEASGRAVQACGERWHDAGRVVLVNRPLKSKDLNDAIKGIA